MQGASGIKRECLHNQACDILQSSINWCAAKTRFTCIDDPIEAEVELLFDAFAAASQHQMHGHQRVESARTRCCSLGVDGLPVCRPVSRLTRLPTSLLEDSSSLLCAGFSAKHEFRFETHGRRPVALGSWELACVWCGVALMYVHTGCCIIFKWCCGRETFQRCPNLNCHASGLFLKCGKYFVLRYVTATGWFSTRAIVLGIWISHALIILLCCLFGLVFWSSPLVSCSGFLHSLASGFTAHS